MMNPSPDGSGNLPILENKALAVAFLIGNWERTAGSRLLKKIINYQLSIINYQLLIIN